MKEVNSNLPNEILKSVRDVEIEKFIEEEGDALRSQLCLWHIENKKGHHGNFGSAYQCMDCMKETDIRTKAYLESALACLEQLRNQQLAQQLGKIDKRLFFDAEYHHLVDEEKKKWKENHAWLDSLIESISKRIQIIQE